MQKTVSTGRGNPSSKTSKRARLTLTLVALLLSSGCELLPPNDQENQFDELPASLTQEPEVKDFLTPWNAILQRSDQEKAANEQTLRDYYKQPRSKPTP